MNKLWQVVITQQDYEDVHLSEALENTDDKERQDLSNPCIPKGVISYT